MKTNPIFTLSHRNPVGLRFGAMAAVMLIAAHSASAELISSTSANGNDFVVTFTGGSGEWTVPPGVTDIQLLVVGGGGTGGQGGGAGGGGAGGLIYYGTQSPAAGTSYTVTAGNSITVSVGAGGAAGGYNNGADSIFGAVTATGGGAGGNQWPYGNRDGNAGGSGGGGGIDGWGAQTGGTGTSGQGNAGGSSSVPSGQFAACGGGGGGAGAAGADGNSVPNSGGNGGTGLTYDISGSAVTYAGGGGAHGWEVVNGSGGPGYDQPGGGGMAAWTGDRNAGLAGVVIVKYTATELTAFLTSPTPGQVYLTGSAVSASALVAAGTSPYTVTFSRKLDGDPDFTEVSVDSESPYTADLGILPAGTYQIKATVTDDASGSASTIHTFTVAPLPSAFTWTNATSGNWSGAANWTNSTGVPAAPLSTGQADYVLHFNQAGTYTATQDLDNGFLLNQLNFGGSTVSLAGNSLVLGGTLPQVNQDSTADVTVSNDLDLAADTTFGGSANGAVTIKGGISGSGSLTKSSPGTLALAAVNSYTGATVIHAGVLKLQGAPADALIHYSLDSADGANVPNTGSLGSAADGTLQNASVVTGQIGNAFSFTGTDSGIVTNNAVEIGNAFTMACWVSTTNSNGGYKRIINNRYSDSAYLGTDNGPNYLTIVRGSFASSSQGVDTSGAWHHLAMTWNGSVQTFYYDGQIVAGYPVAAGGPSNFTGFFGFACNSQDNPGQGAFAESWNGMMDDAYLFGRALNAAEVQSLFGLATAVDPDIADSSSVTLAAGAVFDTSTVASFAMTADQPFTIHLDGTDAGSCGRIHAAALNIANAHVVLAIDATLDDEAYVLADYSSLTGGSHFASVTPPLPSGYWLDYTTGNQIRLVQGEVVLTGYALWAASNAPGQQPDEDYDLDGVSNGVEYFMGETGSAFTANPTLVNTAGVMTVTWPRDSDAAAPFVVQISEDLSEWTDIAPPHASIDETDPEQVTYTLPGGATERFIRLAVRVTQ